MNKATMKELSGCIPPLRMLCSQCEPLTYHGAKDGLQRPKEGLEVGELFVFSEHATTERKPGQAQPDEPDRLGINLGDGEAPVWINFGQWRKLRAYADAVFVADDPECLAHIDGAVLLEAQEKIKTLTRILWDKVEDLAAKRDEAKDFARRAEDLWFPDHKKPNGPLFGDAPIDEAPELDGESDLDEVEEYELDGPTYTVVGRIPGEGLAVGLASSFDASDEDEKPEVDVAQEMAELDQAVGA